VRGPRLAASPLGPRGLVSVPPFPLLGHRVGGRLRYAPQARGAAAGVSPGARPAPRRFALRDPWAPLGSPGSLLTTSHQWGDVVPSRRAVRSPRPTRRSTCARPGQARRYVRRRSAVTTSRGDVRSLPVTTSHQRGDVVSLGERCALLDLRVDLRARGPVGPAATSADARRRSPQGGTRALSPSLPPLLGGGRGGTWSALGKHRAGPALKGGEAGLGPVLSLSRMRSRCGTPIPIVIAPVGTNRCRRIKPLRRPTVPTLSLATVVAPTALSLIGCTILRAVSGILRTQRGRRGSGPRETSCYLLSPLWLISPPLRINFLLSPLAPVAQISAPADQLSLIWSASAVSH
jgi:hypothetical protein